MSLKDVVDKLGKAPVPVERLANGGVRLHPSAIPMMQAYAELLSAAAEMEEH